MARPVASRKAGNGAKRLASFRAAKVVDTTPSANAVRSADSELEEGREVRETTLKALARRASGRLDTEMVGGFRDMFDLERDCGELSDCRRQDVGDVMCVT
jgi:hypothetical protein